MTWGKHSVYLLFLTRKSQYFFFIFDFLQFDKICLGINFLTFILLGVLWPIAMVLFLTLIWKIRSHYCFKYFFCFFFSLFLFLLPFPVHESYTFCICPMFLGHSAFFPPHFISFYWYILKLRDSFFSYVQSTNGPIDIIFHFCYRWLVDLW